jgi:hypothetical protein
MSRYFKDEDHVARIAGGLLDLSLPKSHWSHAAHFAAALWFLRHQPERRLEADMPSIIRAYNEATGVPNTDGSGYHETITQASIAVARPFLNRYPESRPLDEIVDRLMESPLGDSRWLLAHWSQARLFSVEARRRWIEPDLLPLTGTRQAPG